MEKYVLFLVLAVIIVFMQSTAVIGEEKCFKDGRFNLTRATRNNDKIFLLETPRKTHRATNAIFKIILEEILNYTNVEIVNIPQSEEMRLIHRLHETEAYKVPSLRINTEMWTSPDNPLTSDKGENIGALTSAGRYGLFYPTAFGPINLETLKNPSKDIFNIIQNQRNLNAESIYKPKQCENRACLPILASTTDKKINLEEIIEKEVLYVQIVRFSNLSEILNELYSRKQPFIVLYSSPSNIINADIDFTPLILPDFDYESYSIAKYYNLYDNENELSWSTFTPATRGLDILEISDEQFTEIFRKKQNVSEFDMYCKVAKGLIEEKSHFLQDVLPDSNITLFIGGIYPQDGTEMGEIFESATRVINKEVMPPGFSIKIQSRNGNCQADQVLRHVIEYFNVGKIFGILGPACSETIQPIAGISKFLSIPIISYSAEAPVFDQDMYPYFFRTIGSNRQYEDVYIQFFKNFGWKRFATITEEGQKSTEYIINMEKKSEKDNIVSISNIKVTKQMNASDISNHLQDLKNRRVKVILAHVRPDLIEVVLCEAYKLQMTSEYKYVWFLPSSPSTNISDCAPEEIQKALEGHFSFIHKPFNRSSKYIDLFKENNTLCELPDRKYIASRNYFGFAFDAIMAYANAAIKLSVEERKAFNTPDKSDLAKKFLKILWETDFEGVSGRVRFGKGSSRITDITLLQWTNDEYRIVGEYVPTIKGIRENMTTETGKIKINTEVIAWQSTPEDGAYDCNLSVILQFFGSNCDNDTMAVVIMSFLFVLVVLCLSSYCFWKKMYDKKMAKQAKKMRNFGIDILAPASATYNTLDKWEIPKDHIVINRRLGEGEFGTVFGGEAKFPHHDDWIAVAVKSLKCGATNDSKLDFLSEAEAMKRFNHEHIVKLLGVSLQTEPIYTVMEYMLYGDLKTFLLARRHMIHEKIHDDSDIHPKRLTRYALGIAKALKYLGENKFVHRDVACRNVLLSADRVAKLGDFGLARSMYENDYYRFNRKGLMPVRWMAPESLALSVFTPASDIWSFGVLLYEIITFGSFPYQGLTNREALECIVSKQILTIPSDVKPQLEKLIKACWTQESKNRPIASDIITLMEQLPLLVSPCLDVPISSVELHDNNEPININLLAKMGFKKMKPPVIVQMSTINNLDNKKTDANGLLIPMESINVYPIDGEEDEDDVLKDLPPSIVASSASSSSASSSSSYASSTANNSEAASEMYTIETNDEYCPMVPLLNKSSSGTYAQISRPNDLRHSEHGH